MSDDYIEPNAASGRVYRVEIVEQVAITYAATVTAECEEDAIDLAYDMASRDDTPSSEVVLDRYCECSIEVPPLALEGAD